MTISFTIIGKPQGKARPRATKTGRMYTPRNTVLYENEIALFCQMANPQKRPIDGPVGVIILVGKEVPKSDNKSIREAKLSGLIRPTNKPDLDNVVKAVLDGCNGIAYHDDKQVVELHTEAWYTERPAVKVKITELNTAAQRRNRPPKFDAEGV